VRVLMGWKATLFHSSPPFGGCFGANERPAAHSHQRRSVATFGEVVEVRAADAMPASELRNGEGEGVCECKLVSTGRVLRHKRPGGLGIAMHPRA
jgi:hypothetical protein